MGENGDPRVALNDAETVADKTSEVLVIEAAGIQRIDRLQTEIEARLQGLDRVVVQRREFKTDVIGQIHHQLAETARIEHRPQTAFPDFLV